MASEYLDQLSLIIQQATARRFKDVHLECKHFFSGAACYADGRLCISLTPVGFAVKLPEKSRKILLKEPGTKYLRYFPKGPIKKDYVVLPATMLNDMKALRSWVKAAIEYALTLPRPPRKK
jgi:TfoX/Sxy family transcriptional regulator of competence genes